MGDFVGREDELQLIQEKLGGSSRFVINLYGEAGIGKSYLLQEACRMAGQQENAVALVDFDTPPGHILRYIRREIARKLGEPGFASYLHESRYQEELEKRGAETPHLLNLARRKAETEFLKCYDQFASTQRILLAFDTCEWIVGTDQQAPLLDLLSNLKGTLILLAGRNNDEMEGDLEEQFGQDAVKLHRLGPFEQDETRKYIERSRVQERLSEEEMQKLQFLTEGKPLLLGLAMEWIDRHIPLPKLLQESLGVLQQRAESYRKQFDFELVGGIRSLASPLDRAILYMAYIRGSCSAELLYELLKEGENGLTREDAGELLEKLQELFFVRSNSTLHDVMRDLVRDYVWAYVDPRHTERKRLFQSLYEFFGQTLPEEEGWVRWIHLVNMLHYHLRLDFAGGFEHAVDEFDEAIQRHHLFYCELLLDELSSRDWVSEMDELAQTALLIKRARLLTRLGEHEQARRLYSEILETRRMSYADQVEVYSSWAWISSKPEALGLFRRALDIAESNQDRGLVSVMWNNLGRIHRQMGNLEEAVQCYQESLRISKEMGDRFQEAASQNNLAYVYRQLGQLDQALNRARLGFILRKQLGEDPLQMAYSYQTLGAIQRDMGDLTKARDRFESAEKLFQQVGAEPQLGRVLVDQASIYRAAHDPFMVDQLLERAQKLLERREDQGGLGDLFNERGCELRKRAWELHRLGQDPEQVVATLQAAEQDLKQSLRIAEQAENWYRAADNLADLALLYYYWAESIFPPPERAALRELRPRGRVEALSEEEKARLQVLEQTERRYRSCLRRVRDAVGSTLRLSRAYGGYSLFESRAIEVLGQVAYSQGKWFKAFALYYLQSCALMAEHYNSQSKRFREVFDRVHRRVMNLEIPPTQVVRICKYMTRRWRERGLAKIAPGFVETYEAISQYWVEGERL